MKLKIHQDKKNYHQKMEKLDIFNKELDRSYRKKSR